MYTGYKGRLFKKVIYFYHTPFQEILDVICMKIMIVKVVYQLYQSFVSSKKKQLG